MIEVTYTTHQSSYSIKKVLSEVLSKKEVISFDTETKGVYPKEERAVAKEMLKEELEPEVKRQASMIAANSGLSHPSLVEVTHFIFGTSEDHSVIIIADSYQKELLVWNWLKNYKGKVLIHNTLFDLKLMHHRVKSFPKDYEDTALIAKVLINDVENWRSKNGLKLLMGSHYDPAWTLIDEYEPEDLMDTKFLRYASIDGAATFKLWFDIKEFLNDN